VWLTFIGVVFHLGAIAAKHHWLVFYCHVSPRYAGLSSHPGDGFSVSVFALRVSSIQQSARFVAGLLSDGMSVAICYLPLKLMLCSKGSSMVDDTAVKQPL
jgi:hypothetical protein